VAGGTGDDDQWLLALMAWRIPAKLNQASGSNDKG